MKNTLIKMAICLTLISCGSDKTNNSGTAESNNYIPIDSKTEPSMNLSHKMEIFVAADKNWDNIFNFISSKEITGDVMYNAVFFDDKTFAGFPTGKVSGMNFSENQSRHIVATYTKNTLNGYQSLTVFEKNKFESVPQTYQAK